MKSLILKDLLAFQSYVKTLLLFVLFFTIITFSMDDASFLSGMIILWMAMLPISSFSYDQHAKWDLFAQTLPVTRKQIVKAKYVIGLLFVSFATVLAIILNMIVSSMKSLPIEWNVLIESNVMIGIVALVFLSILFPLIYKFGVEKSRMLIIVVVAIPSVIFIYFSNNNLDLLNNVTPQILLAGEVVVAIIVMGISYITSLKIYTAKDF
ncbi:ABC-2 transporter permease [Bacillus sp. AGMB 02131]|uniref:ABC-2 transporter permease n=1 Tax=Peribacillus faecalis TaxID=2772559 RepID=A0A927CXS3_9BACI|nr:ABC-2 transporter permease [Peribacillus faecalis]MBD3109682.1 ABC-2 transporter permease [Peribacillus faecalis]